MGQILDVDINGGHIANSQLEGCTIKGYTNINGATISSSHLASPAIYGGHVEQAVINKCLIVRQHNDISAYVQLTDVIDKLESDISVLKQQNAFLLKLLVAKGVLNDTSELAELIDSSKIVKKLSEGEKSNAKS